MIIKDFQSFCFEAFQGRFCRAKSLKFKIMIWFICLWYDKFTSKKRKKATKDKSSKWILLKGKTWKVKKCFTFQEEQRPYIGLINNNGYACLACYFIANSPHEITEHMALCHSSQLHQNNQIQIQNNNEALNQSMQHSPKIDDGSDRGSPMNMMQSNAGTPPSR